MVHGFGGVMLARALSVFQSARQGHCPCALSIIGRALRDRFAARIWGRDAVRGIVRVPTCPAGTLYTQSSKQVDRRLAHAAGCVEGDETG